MFLAALVADDDRRPKTPKSVASELRPAPETPVDASGFRNVAGVVVVVSGFRSVAALEFRNVVADAADVALADVAGDLVRDKNEMGVSSVTGSWGERARGPEGGNLALSAN